MKEMIYFMLIIILTQMGCSFITTAAGSFVGNLGADMVEDKLKKNAIEEMFKEDQKIITELNKAEI